MKTKEQEKMVAGISDAAVKAKTGKSWDEWIAVLDKAGAMKMAHPEIATYLHEKQGVPDWWSQMVTVGYEQAKGLRGKHQVVGGYQISVSKTLEAPLPAAYKAWADDKARMRWLPGEAITIRKANLNKNLRVTWSDGKSSLDVRFYEKGGAKSQVVVQHDKLPNAAQAERMKAYWKEALERFGRIL
jgi:uncharacterized protein YndB with AHSA1/START domain